MNFLAGDSAETQKRVWVDQAPYSVFRRDAKVENMVYLGSIQFLLLLAT